MSMDLGRPSSSIPASDIPVTVSGAKGTASEAKHTVGGIELTFKEMKKNQASSSIGMEVTFSISGKTVTKYIYMGVDQQYKDTEAERKVAHEQLIEGAIAITKALVAQYSEGDKGHELEEPTVLKQLDEYHFSKTATGEIKQTSDKVDKVIGQVASGKVLNPNTKEEITEEQLNSIGESMLRRYQEYKKTHPNVSLDSIPKSPATAEQPAVTHHSPEECRFLCDFLHGGHHVKFNKIADEMKKKPTWETDLKGYINELGNNQITAFLMLKKRDLRGFDQEILFSMLVHVQEAAKAKNISVGEDFYLLIAHLSVPIHNHVVLEKKGKGAVNVVSSFTAPDGTTYIFKPSPDTLSRKVKIKEQLAGTAAASGIPPGDAAHLPSRAVASSCVDTLLYGNDTVSVKTQFAIINGQRGIMMSEATGKSPKTVEGTEEEYTISDPKIQQNIDTLIHAESPVTDKTLQTIARLLNCRKVRVKFDLMGKNYKLMITPLSTLINFDPDNRVTAQGLLKLQIKDFITGECDRHPYNYFINGATGKVTGIDEDCCFGRNAVPDNVDVREQRALLGIIPNNSSLMLRMPAVITKEILTQVNAMSEEALRETLEPYIAREELEATVQRLNMLKRHINDSGNCLVVDDLLSDAARERMDSNNSYWAREVYLLDSQQKSWNYLRKGIET